MATKTYELTDEEVNAIHLAISMYLYLNLEGQAKTNPEAAVAVEKYQAIKKTLYMQSLFD